MQGLKLTSTAGNKVKLALSGRPIYQSIHLAWAEVVAQLCSKCGNCTAAKTALKVTSASLGCRVLPVHKTLMPAGKGNECMHPRWADTGADLAVKQNLLALRGMLGRLWPYARPRLGWGDPARPCPLNVDVDAELGLVPADCSWLGQPPAAIRRLAARPWAAEVDDALPAAARGPMKIHCAVLHTQPRRKGQPCGWNVCSSLNLMHSGFI